MADGLTPHQERVLNTIRDFIRREGYSPSIGEVARSMNRHPTAAVAVLNRLEAAGRIRRAPQQGRQRVARSIVVIDPTPSQGSPDAPHTND